MFFVKIVSDHFQLDKIDSNIVNELIQQNISEIAAWITRLHDGMINNHPLFTPDEENLLTEVSKNLKLTVSMQHQFRQAMYYYKLQYGSFSEHLSSFFENETVFPIKNKYERKKCFEQIMREFT
jgi:hypothetical protein